MCSDCLVYNITLDTRVMGFTIVALQNGIRCQSQLPVDVITEINKVINQNQLLCEELAIKHCRLQHQLNSKLGIEDGKQLRFYRRRDLRFLFESAKDILWHYWRSSNNKDPDFDMLLSAQKYVKASLEGFVECVLESFASGSPPLDYTTISTSSFSSLTTQESIEPDAKERVSVNDSCYGSIELQLLVPAVTFSGIVTYHLI
jgi:hypothetical protein